MNAMVSVIYVNFNSSAFVLDSIASLAANCKDVPFDVIIVDNASKLAEREVLKIGLAEGGWKNTKIIYSEENLGFGKANNLGARHSNGKYLLFLNPDTLACNDILKIFRDFLESSEPRVVACGGNLLTADARPNSSFGNFPGLLQELGNLGLGLSILLGRYYQRKIAINAVVEKPIPFRVPYIVGADVFILANAFKNLGGFDEGFFMYYEETDLFFRLSKKGLYPCIVPDARIVHFEGGSVNAYGEDHFNYIKFEMLLSSKLYYYKKWRSRFIIPVFKFLFFAQILTQFAKGRMGSKLKPLLKIYFSTVGRSTNKQGSLVVLE